jgi:hypothetical protein
MSWEPIVPTANGRVDERSRLISPVAGCPIPAQLGWVAFEFPGALGAKTKILCMTLDEFRASIKQKQSPATLPPLLAALWWEANGNWDQAHEIAQAEDGADAAWVHAYLHRKEGDTGNAGYWYRQARQANCTLPLEKEWEQIVSALLNKSS